MNDNKSGRRVEYVRFHEGLFFPEFGNIGVVMPPPGKTLVGLEMYYDKTDLTVFFRGEEMAVPAANIAALKYTKEAPAPKRALSGELQPTDKKQVA